MKCPRCGREAECDMVDNGVGMQQCGPYGCEPCGWVQPDPHALLVNDACIADDSTECDCSRCRAAEDAFWDEQTGGDA